MEPGRMEPIRLLSSHRPEGLPETFIRFIGHLITKPSSLGKRAVATLRDMKEVPKEEIEEGPPGPVKLPKTKKDFQHVESFLQYVRDEEEERNIKQKELQKKWIEEQQKKEIDLMFEYLAVKDPKKEEKKDENIDIPKATKEDKSKATKEDKARTTKEDKEELREETALVPTELGRSLSRLLAEAARRQRLKHPDPTGLELSQAEKIRLRKVRERVTKEEKMGPMDEVEPGIFVQKLLEENGIVILASSKCPFCARLVYLFEMHNRSYKLIRLDRMGYYGKNTFNYILENWAELKVPNLYFHGRHIEVEDLSGEICWMNAAYRDPVLIDPSFYDLIVVGGGQIGMAAAIAGAELKKKVCLIDCTDDCPKDRGWELGQTANSLGGLIKWYFHQIATDLIHTKESSFYGWGEKNFGVNWPFLVREVQQDIKRIDWEYRVNLRKAGVCYLNCKTVLLDQNTVEIGSGSSMPFQLKSKYILLAVKAKAYIPQIPGNKYCITSEELFLREQIPGQTLIVGGSTGAVELACILRCLGYPVTLMISGPLLKIIDNEIAEEIIARLNFLGVEIVRDCLIVRVNLIQDSPRKLGQGDELHFSNKGSTVLDTSKPNKNADKASRLTLDGPKKKGKGKKGKGKKGKGKKGKDKKEPKPEETESQKTLVKKNENLLNLIKKVMTSKRFIGKRCGYTETKKSPTFEGLPILEAIAVFGNGTIHGGKYNTVVIASGDITSTKFYGFKKAGIDVNFCTGKINTNEKGETNIPNIYAFGDIVEGKFNGTTAAVCSATNLVKKLFGAVDICEGVLCRPEVLLLPPLEYARVGLSEQAAQSMSQGKAQVGKRWFWPLSSTFLQDHTGRTFIKIIVLPHKNKKEEIVGIHVLGRNAGSTALGLAAAMKKSLYMDDLEQMVPINYTNTQELTQVFLDSIKPIKKWRKMHIAEKVEVIDPEPGPETIEQIGRRDGPESRSLVVIEVKQNQLRKDSRVTFSHK